MAEMSSMTTRGTRGTSSCGLEIFSVPDWRYASLFVGQNELGG